MNLKPIGESLPSKGVSNVSNVNKDKNNIVNGDISKFELNTSTFTPNTEKTQLAEEISTKLGDRNYACFLDVVNKIGCTNARRLLSSVLRDIEEKKKTSQPVRKPGAWFMWKYKKNIGY